MFNTIGHTFELMKMSWGVLMKDRELLWFPVFSAIGVGIVTARVIAVGEVLVAGHEPATRSQDTCHLGETPIHVLPVMQ